MTLRVLGAPAGSGTVFTGGTVTGPATFAAAVQFTEGATFNLSTAIVAAGTSSTIVDSEQESGDTYYRWFRTADGREGITSPHAPPSFGVHDTGDVGVGSDYQRFFEGIQDTMTMDMYWFPPTHLTDGTNYLYISNYPVFPLSGSPTVDVGVLVGSMAALATSGTLTAYDVINGGAGTITYTSKTGTGSSGTLVGCTSTGLATSTDTSQRYQRWVMDRGRAPIEWLADYGGHYLNDLYNFRYDGVYTSAPYDILIGYLSDSLRNTGSAIILGNDRNVTMGRGNDIYGNGQILFNTTGTGGPVEYVLDIAGFYPSTGVPLGSTYNPWSNIYFYGGAYGPIYDEGGAVFNVKNLAYGATGNGSTDDTTAVQAAITAAGVHGGTVYFPDGTYATAAGIVAPNNPNIKYAGAGLSSKILATSTNAPFTITGQAFVEDLVFDGGTTAPYAAYQTIATESSYPSLWKNVVWQNATTYQYVNNQCEDVLYEGCITPGNETAGTSANSIKPSVHIITPFGSVAFHGCKLFGENKLNTQQATYVGGVAGPIVFDSTSLPNSGSHAVLSLTGTYLYDAGTTGNACIDTGNNLPNIEANGVIFNMSHSTWFINGNIPAGAQLALRGCQYAQYAATGTSISLVNASGSGTIVFDGGGVVVNNATTVTLFTGVSSPTTVVQYMNPIAGVTSPTGTKIFTTNSTLDDGQGNLQTGGSVQAGGAGVKLTNGGILDFLSSTGTMQVQGTTVATATTSGLSVPGVIALVGGTNTSGGATASTPTFTSGTARQCSTTTDVMLYVEVTTAATLAISIGPTSTPADAVLTSETSALGLQTYRVPAGWYVKITGTIADLSITQITC
jgi:hypothetical protein